MLLRYNISLRCQMFNLNAILEICYKIYFDYFKFNEKIKKKKGKIFNVLKIRVSVWVCMSSIFSLFNKKGNTHCYHIYVLRIEIGKVYDMGYRVCIYFEYQRKFNHLMILTIKRTEENGKIYDYKRMK